MQNSNPIVAKIPLSTGEVLVVKIPRSLSQCSIGPIIEFDVAYEELVLSLGVEDNEQDKKDGNIQDKALNYMLGIAKCVAAFSDEDIDLILKATYEEALNDKMFDTYPEEELDELDGITAGLTKVFNIIYQLRTSFEYNGKGNIFEYKDRVWEIPEKRVNEITGATDYDVVSVGQMISIFRQKKALSESPEDVPEKDRRYSDRLRTLAILAESDDLKYDGTDKYVENMSAYFEDIDAQTAENAAFFLLTTSMTSNPSLKIGGFLTHQTSHLEILSQSISRRLKTLRSGTE